MQLERKKEPDYDIQPIEILIAVIQAAEDMGKLNMIYAIATFFLAEVKKLCFLVNTKKNPEVLK